MNIKILHKIQYRILCDKDIFIIRHSFFNNNHYDNFAFFQGLEKCIDVIWRDDNFCDDDNDIYQALLYKKPLSKPQQLSLLLTHGRIMFKIIQLFTQNINVEIYQPHEKDK